jgi:DNA-binding IclR family transcriptional regulator
VSPSGKTRRSTGARAAGALPPYRAPALEKGIAILELLAGARQPLAVGEIADTLQRSRSEIYRMLVVLEALEYLRRTSEGRYDLTAKLFDIASRHAPKRSVVAAARPVMEELAEATSQSCHLMVNSGDHMVCVAREESPAAIGFAVQVGFRPAMLQSTSGRVYFAFQDEARRELLLHRMRRGGPGSAVLRELAAGVRAIVRRGYATEPSRLTTGIQDLSAPVFGPQPGQAVACLTIPFVSHRLFRCSLAQAVALLLDAARRISATLRAGGASVRAPPGVTAGTATARRPRRSRAPRGDRS